MLTPEQLASIPDEYVALMVELEEDILADMARRYKENLSFSDTALHQAEILIQAGYDAQEIQDAFLERVDMTEADYKKMLLDAAELSYRQDTAAYLIGGKELPEYAGNDALLRMVQANIENGWMGFKNTTNTIGFIEEWGHSGLDDYYKKTLGNATFQVASGFTDVDTALRRLVKDTADTGIRFVEYERAGTWQVDTAARRNVLTTLNQMTGQMSIQNADDMDQDLMEITAHAGARPSHAAWQGEIVSRSGKTGYLTLDDIEYGEVTGFQGANCRHHWHPFFEGISERAWSDQDLAEIDNEPFEYMDKEYTHYEATQRMRQLERQMRVSKRQLIVFEAAQLETDFTNASIKLRRQRENYLDFATVADLKPQLHRIGVNEYGHSLSMKSVWAYRKAGGLPPMPLK